MRCTEAAIVPLRRRGICLATYLKDWLLLAQLKQEGPKTWVFIISVEKSKLSPAQDVVLLGLALCSVFLMARLSEE